MFRRLRVTLCAFRLSQPLVSLTTRPFHGADGRGWDGNDCCMFCPPGTSERPNNLSLLDAQALVHLLSFTVHHARALSPMASPRPFHYMCASLFLCLSEMPTTALFVASCGPLGTSTHFPPPRDIPPVPRACGLSRSPGLQPSEGPHCSFLSPRPVCRARLLFRWSWALVDECSHSRCRIRLSYYINFKLPCYIRGLCLSFVAFGVSYFRNVRLYPTRYLLLVVVAIGQIRTRPSSSDAPWSMR